MIPINYGEPTDIIDSHLPINLDEIRIIVVDFSFDKDTNIRLSGAREIIILDHHKTAQTECEGLAFCKFDMNECGATLAWKYFFNKEPIPVLLQYIRSANLWDFGKLINENEVTAYIRSWPQTIQAMIALDRLLEVDITMASMEGKGINRSNRQLVDSICDNAWITNIQGYKVPTLNTNVFQSLVGNQLCKLHRTSKFSATFFVKENGDRVYSLRSIGDFDVSEVAKKYLGGGGHKNAAGFTIKMPLVEPRTGTGSLD